MLTGLSKYTGKAVRSRGSSPKLQVFNTALLTAQAGLTPAEARADSDFWGRLTESAVGAHLANAAASGFCDLYYWREGNREVDFVLRKGRTLVGIEVKSGRAPLAHSGLAAFREVFKPKRTLLVGDDGIPVEEFLSRPVAGWLHS
jgi:predicted AAA+ superfamily ATPase